MSQQDKRKRSQASKKAARSKKAQKEARKKHVNPEIGAVAIGNFQAALNALRAGQSVFRNSGTWIGRSIQIDKIGLVRENSGILWTPLQVDILADDWHRVLTVHDEMQARLKAG